jgi:hypothetical protein
MALFIVQNYIATSPKMEEEFKSKLARQFDINFIGNASWFLQMRIHQHQDGSYSIDQHRYTLNVLQCYDPEVKYKLRKTPAPPTYIYSKDNYPSTDEDKHQINKAYPDIDFHSAICSLLYLAYST